MVVVSIDADRPAINAGRSHFAPHPHHVVIPADQSGQIPARVLRLSHSAKKIEALFWAGRISYAVSAFSFLRLGSGREQAIKKLQMRSLHRESSLENLLVWRIRMRRRPAKGCGD